MYVCVSFHAVICVAASQAETMKSSKPTKYVNKYVKMHKQQLALTHLHIRIHICMYVYACESINQQEKDTGVRVCVCGAIK